LKPFLKKLGEQLQQKRNHVHGEYSPGLDIRQRRIATQFKNNHFAEM